MTEQELPEFVPWEQFSWEQREAIAHELVTVGEFAYYGFGSQRRLGERKDECGRATLTLMEVARRKNLPFRIGAFRHIPKEHDGNRLSSNKHVALLLGTDASNALLVDLTFGQFADRQLFSTENPIISSLMQNGFSYVTDEIITTLRNASSTFVDPELAPIVLPGIAKLFFDACPNINLLPNAAFQQFYREIAEGYGMSY